MTEQGPSPLYKTYSTYLLLDALWAWEFARIKARWEEELEAKHVSWRDVLVLDSTQPIHIEPLGKSEMDKLFDKLSTQRSGSVDPGHTRAAFLSQEDDSSE